jgi:two-component system, NarL family, response regulator DegU
LSDLKLTKRELEIAALLVDGLANKQIAFRLSIGLSTVRNHVSSIMRKLDVQNRVQAAIRLYQAGIRPGT